MLKKKEKAKFSLYTRVNVNAYFFIILGAMEGLLCGLVAAFLLDYLTAIYDLTSPLSYLDWVCVLSPIFGVIGALFNFISAIFLYDEDAKKPKRRFRLR